MTNHTDKDALLHEINDETAVVLIPAMLYCGMLMLVGTVGNTMVVFYYGFKSKTTPATCFIMALAIFDLIACLLGIPIEITDMRFFYVFDSVIACRLLAFVNHFAVIGSAFTLSAIAFDRYRRICKPFEKQLSVRQSKIICVVCAFLGVFLGWPSIALFTVEKVNITTTFHDEIVHVTGNDCTSIKDEDYEVYAWVFSVIQFLGFFGIAITLIVSYFLVGRQLYKHKKFRFYVAQKTLRRTASGNMTTMTTNTDMSMSEPQMNSTVPIASIPEEDEDEFEDDDELEEVEYEGPDFDSPRMEDSIPDLRELLELDINGLPDVDEDRPASRVRGYLSDRPTSGGRLSRPSSILTDLSKRSSGSIMTVRSVTICDDSENVVFSIDPRDPNDKSSWRPKSARSNSTWSNSITRPGSVTSIHSDIRPSNVTSHHDNSPDDGQYKTIPIENSTTKTHSLFSNGTKANSLKRTKSDGCVESRTLRRTNSDKKVPTTSGRGLRRTVSEGSGLKRTASNGSTISSRLRRTGSCDSAKMNTDVDPLKDMRMKMLDINTVKYTVIMIVIGVVFILSCVPYLCLAVWRVYSDDNLVYTFSNGELVMFQIGLRSYFLNCSINPFIYGFFNSQFRAFFHVLCCSWRTKAGDSDDGDMEGSDQRSPRRKTPSN